MGITRRTFMAGVAPVTLCLGTVGLAQDVQPETPARDYSHTFCEILDAHGGDAMLVYHGGYRPRIVYEPIAGRDFWQVAREAIRLATAHDASTFYSFNGCPVLAYPNSKIDELYRHYELYYWPDGNRP